MSHRTILIIKILCLALFICIVPFFIDAGIVSSTGIEAVFVSWWGKSITGGLLALLLVYISQFMLREYLAERRARRDLCYMASYSPFFEWWYIEERAKNCVHRIHAAWSKEDAFESCEWMTDWFWQNQQLAHLESWKEDGLVNICNIKDIYKIKPLLFMHHNRGGAHEGSMLVLSITARMQSYIEKDSTGEVVKGSKRFRIVKTIWTLTMVDNSWVVSYIEKANALPAYTKLIFNLPKIEDTVVPVGV